MWHNVSVPGLTAAQINSESAYLMLLQTNSYVVPREKRAEHARLMRRFRQVLNRLGCDNFEVYEQVGANWSNTQSTGRVVQIMRFRDRKHQLAVQAAERNDPAAQELIAEFCDLVNYPAQQQQGQFAVGFYTSVLPVTMVRTPLRPGEVDAAAHEPHPHAESDPDAASFGSALVTTETFGPADDTAPEPLNEAEADAAADDFAAPAEQAESGLEEHAAPNSEEAAPEATVAEEDATLPTLASEPPPDAPTDELAAPEGEPAAAADEPAHSPSEEKNGEFDLDNLENLDEGDLEITDDDLARLAQELSHDPPHPQGGKGSNPPNSR
jgi:hypothetical protein